MNRTLRTAAALLLLAGATATFAQTLGLAGDAPYARYRSADGTLAPTPPASRAVAGPNAQHLIYLGVDPRIARQQALAAGELPRAAAPAATLPVDGYDQYARNAAMAAEAARGLRQSMR